MTLETFRYSSDNFNNSIALKKKSPGYFLYLLDKRSDSLDDTPYTSTTITTTGPPF